MMASSLPRTVPPAEPLAPPVDASSGQLDRQALARLQELDPDGRHGVVPRVMHTFENSLIRMRAQLLDAGVRGDAATVGAVAHTLKSSSASVGALLLSERCAQTERAVRAGQTEGLDQRVGELAAEADRVLVAVRAMLEA